MPKHSYMKNLRKKVAILTVIPDPYVRDTRLIHTDPAGYSTERSTPAPIGYTRHRRDA